MNKFLPILALLSFSMNALSLGELNCSDAKGELKRVEIERWGANDINWYWQGTALSPESPVRIEVSEDRTQVYGTEDNGHYVTDVTVYFTDGRESVTKTVLCEAWRNGAID